jgi:hypothetical protein
MMRGMRDKTVLRFFLYFFLVALLFQGLVWIAQSGPDGLNLFVQSAPDDDLGNSEFSKVELLQSGCLAIGLLLSVWIYTRNDHRRLVALAVAVLQSLMLIREQDFFFEVLVGRGMWQIPVYLSLIGGIFVFVRSRDRVNQSWLWMRQRSWFGLLFAALTIILAFSRVFGQSDFWEAIMGDNYQRIVKLAAEEVTELLGYSLLVIAMIEMTLDDKLDVTPTRDPG